MFGAWWAVEVDDSVTLTCCCGWQLDDDGFCCWNVDVFEMLWCDVVPDVC
jgi:hypothetical protein